MSARQRAMFAANKVPAPPDVTHLCEAQGCQECRETGYKGRIALMELCPFNSELADLVAVNAPQGEMRKIASREGLRTLYQEGMQQVLEGETSMDEIKCLAYTAVAKEGDLESTAEEEDKPQA
jgi:type II secretory ATPase GspE/PulE/Tfp pilus assembly ATPase PilB-like protein